MNKRYLSTLMLAILLIVLVTACTPQMTASSSDQDGSSSQEFDAQFIRMMVPHHEGALEMAKIAKDRSQRPEIQQMSEAILSTQTQEIEQMKSWLLAWYGESDVPPMSAMPMLEGASSEGHGHSPQAATMDMQADVEKLRGAAEPFDKAFIDAMILHHQSAIDAAHLAQEKAARPEIKTLAQAILTAQQAEIDQMRSWRSAWFVE